MGKIIKGLPYILLSPTDEIPLSLCKTVGQAVGDFFGYPIRVNALLTDIEFAFNVDRDQYHSTSILDEVSKRIPGGCVKIIILTDKDLFIPILTHVYGEAQLNGTTCIVSTHRLSRELPLSESAVVERIIKECIHELGHTFNLRHCKEETCIMHYCRSLDDVDLKSDRFCRYCEVFLADAVKLL